MKKQLIIIDNYDSFTYNLVQFFGELGEEPTVFRNDAITIDDIATLKPSHIVISPGPGRPSDAGISKSVIKTFGETIPILGVCLGHQSIGEVFGAKVVHAPSLVHGKTSMIQHTNIGIFKKMPNPFKATRYHSLVLEKNSIPDCFNITATVDDAIVMGIQHKDFPIEGIQFHPESILTERGIDLLANFLAG